MAHEGNHICLYRFSFIYAVNDLWEDAYICQIYTVNCTTGSAIYVMELTVMGWVPILGSTARNMDWRIFIDTILRLLYTKPTSKSLTNNSYDYEKFIIVIILNNVSVCRSKTWYKVKDMISKFSAGSAGDSILMNNSMPGASHLKKANADRCAGQKWKTCKAQKEYREDLPAVQYHRVQITGRWQWNRKTAAYTTSSGCHPNTACHSPKAVKGA